MSEATLQADLKREILQLTHLFGEADVVIDDWSILDGGNANAPYVIIVSSDTLEVTRIQTDDKLTSWTIPFYIIVKFDDWDSARSSLGATRQGVLDHLKATEGYLDASGRLAWGLRSIRALEPVSEIYDRFIENPEEALPVFLAHKLGAVVEEVI